MNNKVVLSISILMSGRKETRKCLESLKELMEQVSCELIIVDTGCDDATKAIIKEYTDIILPFTWCNDFAKARNVGLDRAIGEWFMYMDDDEWFEDTSEIIDFFNSGEYKEFKLAFYNVRNYSDLDGKNYIDGRVSRMIKLDDNVKFMGKVHEYLYPSTGNIRLFSSYVHHYGYVFSSDKELRKHTQRNVDLLEKLLIEEKENLRWIVQIMPEYISLGENKRAVELAKEGLCIYKEMNNKGLLEKKQIGGILGFMMKAFINLGEFEKVVEEADDFIIGNIITDLAKAFMYKCKVIAYFNLKKYDKCIEACNKYMDYYMKLHDDDIRIAVQGGLLIESTFSNIEMQEAIRYVVKAAIEENRFDVVEKYLEKYDMENKDLFYYIQNIEDRLNNTKELSQDNTEGEEKDEKYANLNSIFNNIIRVFSKIDEKYWYIIYLKILDKDNNNSGECLYELYDELFDKIADIFSLDKNLWAVAEKYDVDMDALIRNIDFDKWQAGVDHWCNRSNVKKMEYIENLVKKWNTTNNIRYNYLNMKIVEKRLVNINMDDIEFDILESKIENCANITKEYYENIYKESIFEEMTEVLPMPCRFALTMLDIIKTRKENGKKALEKLKGIVDKYGYYVDIINIYSKLLGEHIIEENRFANKAKQEMLELAIILKIKAREYIENGNIEQAKVILQNVIQNVPNDKEAKEILSMIE